MVDRHLFATQYKLIASLLRVDLVKSWRTNIMPDDVIKSGGLHNMTFSHNRIRQLKLQSCWTLFVVWATTIACGLSFQTAVVPTIYPTEETESPTTAVVEGSAINTEDVDEPVRQTSATSTMAASKAEAGGISTVTVELLSTDIIETIVPTARSSATATKPVPAQDSTPQPALSLDDLGGLDRRRKELQERVESPEWVKLGVPETIDAQARAFLLDASTLDENSIQWFHSLLDQWRLLDGLISRQVVAPNGVKPEIRLWDRIDLEGTQIPVLYARASGDMITTEQLFTVIHGEKGSSIGLALAPQLEKLTQQISLNGQNVEYVDESGKVLVTVDARPVDQKDPDQEALHEHLVDLYSKNNSYSKASVFPRYVISVDGIEAGFMGIEYSLSHTQIVLLNDAFSLYSRPELVPLKTAMFGRDISVIVLDRLYIASGLNYSGTGSIILDRRDLFGNKYQLAQVLAHEAAHVLQGDLGKKVDVCDQLLRREVADQTIPLDMLDWDADQVVAAIKDGTIGAYHVSMWILNQLNIRDLEWLQQVIKTGKFNGQSLLIGCDE